ncbi:hypothetical protein Vretifemale_10539 [Volvox reticuliferus]|uniref:Uncharacterized protein n=1 Tax=Volvox reticuliferus TaxID=1737510 RepID=A0A8J4CMK9_9CHLO|nr:hypothetical protein Vretifemale_10539 [Volvox reticuliferus]
MQQHPAAVQPGGANSRQRSRNTSSSDSSVSKASGREACEPDVGEVSKFDALQHLSSESALSAQPLVLDCMDLDLDSDLSSDEGREEISDLDPEPVDLDSQTWRMASWEVAVELLRDRDFPLPAMLTALPLGPRALAALRCRTGSADDLGFYVPQLRTQDVARLNASAGKLAEWLLGVEAHCRAAHEADQARAWSWPRRMTEKHEAIVVSETRQRGLIDGYQTVEADGRTVASDARGIGHENQGQTGADEAASGGGGAGGAVRSCEEPCDGACAIEKGEPRDAGLEMGENTGSGRDVQTRGSADGWDGITGVQHVGYLGEAGRDGRWRWPSAAAAARSMRECVEALLEERRAAAMARAAAEAEARAAAAAAAAAVAIAGTTAAAVPTVMQLVGEPRALSSADPLRTEWGMAADLGIRIRSGMSRPCFAEAEDWEPDLEDSESDATSSGR